MKFRKLLVIGLLASLGLSSALLAKPSFVGNMQEAQIYATPIQDTILLIDSIGSVYNGGSVFDIDPSYGNEVFINAELINAEKTNDEIDLSIYINNQHYQTYTLNKENSYIHIPLTINEFSQIRLVKTVKQEGKETTLAYNVHQRITNWDKIESNVSENADLRPSVLVEDSTHHTLNGESIFDVNSIYGKEVNISVMLLNNVKTNLDLYVNDIFVDTITVDKNNALNVFTGIILENKSQIKIVEKVPSGKTATIRYIVSQR